MRLYPIGASLVCALILSAQEKPAATAGITAEQIMEKSIEASGGRAAMEKMTSMVVKANMDAPGMGMKATMEIYSKAPNKRLIVTRIEGMGEIKQGFDGKIAWSEDPQRGVVEVTGQQLAETARDSVFNSELKWREMYSKLDLKGKEKVGEREAYVIEMTPKEGSPTTRLFDAQTFLMIRQLLSRATPQGVMEIKSDFSDYREVNGVKIPFQMMQQLPMGQFNITLTEVNHNVPIEDAKFAKPAAQ